MTDIEPLILDLLEWLDKEPRRYLDVMYAWWTSCPRLSIWEESLKRGSVAGDGNAFVRITDQGRTFLRICAAVDSRFPGLRGASVNGA